MGGRAQASADPGDPSRWRQLSFELPRDRVPELEALLELAGALVSWTEDAADAPVLEPAPGETPLWPRVRITALFDPAVAVAAIRAAVAGLDAGIAATLADGEVADRDWDADWQRSLKPRRYGAQLWVCPPGQPAPAADAVRIELAPGLAFGTGTHPTTAMCLDWLAATPPAGATLLDYGCGSGILAVAALALGARHATGVDLDPQAITATGDNAARNGQADRLRVLLPEALAADARFDVVVANILSGPLVALAPRLAAHLASHGRVALSGILTTQADEVRQAWAPWVKLSTVATRDDWALLAGQRQD